MPAVKHMNIEALLIALEVAATIANGRESNRRAVDKLMPQMRC